MNRMQLSGQIKCTDSFPFLILHNKSCFNKTIWRLMKVLNLDIFYAQPPPECYLLWSRLMKIPLGLEFVLYAPRPRLPSIRSLSKKEHTNWNYHLREDHIFSSPSLFSTFKANNVFFFNSIHWDDIGY